MEKVYSNDPDWYRQLEESRRSDQQRIAKHGPNCYGPYGACISCGCSRGRPCVSHKGSPRHMAELGERLAAALERLADKP